MALSRGIAMADNTARDQPTGDEEELESESDSEQQPVSVVRRVTGATGRPIRKARNSHARRKYSKWQQNRYGGVRQDNSGSGSTESSSSRINSMVTTQDATTINSRASQAIAEQSGSEVVVPENESISEPMAEEPRPQTEIDILYENQRGWFFFGLPVFSERSLLNFDPPSWMTRSGERSPVDITNAQVPDPSWEWSWRTWYVDMSHDVDDEGWQYSLSFASKFPWHGTHPWLHSFVRRRRWLRQRAKKSLLAKRRAKGNWQSHVLSDTGDYFTVKSPSIRSYEPSVGPNGARSSHVSTSRFAQEEYEMGVPAEEITNVVALSKALRLATLDRQKIDAVKEFVHRGGEELVYLEGKIPDLLSVLLFQTSRQHLLEALRSWIEEIPSDTADKAEKERRQNLVKAMRVADEHFHGGRFWTEETDIPVIREKQAQDTITQESSA